jgi:hypothetical protein
MTQRRLATVTATSQPLRREGHYVEFTSPTVGNPARPITGSSFVRNSRCLLTAIPRERVASAPIAELPSDCPAASAAYCRFPPLPAAPGLPGGDAPERLTGGGPPPAAAKVVAAAVATPHLGGSVWRQQAPAQDVSTSIVEAPFRLIHPCNRKCAALAVYVAAGESVSGSASGPMGCRRRSRRRDRPGPAAGSAGPGVHRSATRRCRT